jgi:UDP-N-acetylmuramate dehydrogenase
LKIHTNFPLKSYNTFGLDVKANYFVEVHSRAQLIEFLQVSPLRTKLSLVLGGGSNMLLTKDIEGAVLHIAMGGKRIVEEAADYAIVEANAGENWHDLVVWAIDQNLGGIENLSLIPGNTGTAPMQNIGAYGVELKDVFVSLDAVHLKTGALKTFSKEDCKFAYRESVFKNAEKGNYIIAAVRLKLNKPPHTLSTHYGAIKAQLQKMGIERPGIRDVSQAVIHIRQSKLPDPKDIGNSGSFFKNPIVPEKIAHTLLRKHPEMPVFPAQKGQKKLAAGWLIEQAGWKGYRKGDAGVHQKQALVLVNYGQATGTEILALAHSIIDDVRSKFGITLAPEVNVL